VSDAAIVIIIGAIAGLAMLWHAQSGRDRR